MKPFSELTHLELIALDRATIDRYIDLECAEEGIALIDATPPTLPATAPPGNDQTAYCLAAFFVHRADAEQVAAFAARFARVTKEYKTLPGKTYKSTYVFEPTIPDSELTVAADTAFSQEVYAKRASVIAAAEREKGEYETAKAAYDRAIEQRLRVASRFQEAIDEARASEAKRAGYQSLFSRYLDLAEGVRRTACRFMVNTHADAPDVIPEMYTPDESGPIMTTPRKYEIGESADGCPDAPGF